MATSLDPKASDFFFFFPDSQVCVEVVAAGRAPSLVQNVAAGIAPSLLQPGTAVVALSLALNIGPQLELGIMP